MKRGAGLWRRSWTAAAPRLAAATLLIVAPAWATRAWADELSGIWKLDATPVELRFASCGDAVCGLIETSARLQADPDARDIKNPVVALRSRHLKGLAMLDHLHPASDGWKGRVYLPGSGASYDVEVRRVDPDHLKAKGRVAPLLCQTYTLTRKS